MSESEHEKPYVWGGQGSEGFDPSELTEHVAPTHDVRGPEQDMSKVDTIAWGPSDPAELDKLKSRYLYVEATGTFSVKVGD